MNDIQFAWLAARIDAAIIAFQRIADVLEKQVEIAQKTLDRINEIK